MYGCYDPYLIYGFAECNRDEVIDNDWLTEYFPDISAYPLDVVKNYAGEFAYGVTCELNQATGKISIGEETKQIVQKLFEKVQKRSKNDERTIGYFLVLSGDYELEHTPYLIEDD